jgi:hypothetical protein
LNATAAVLLVTAYVLIKQGRREAHKRVMLAAFAVSSVFLVCYLIYHAQVGSVHYPHTGLIRTVYLTILTTHTITRDHHAAPRSQGRVCPPQSHCPLDFPHLALRQCDRRGGIPDAVPVLNP